MNKLDADFQSVCQNKLKADLISLEYQINELKKQDPFSDPDRLNDNAAIDQEAGEESTHERYQALIDQVNQNIDQIKSALKRIEADTYGICQSCGGLIDKRRLLVLPTATMCQRCESR